VVVNGKVDGGRGWRKGDGVVRWEDGVGEVGGWRREGEGE
jgi:hypothetical protein